jgi:predicted nucleic acid-binding protein
MIAIDTNVLVYSVDEGNPDKKAQARATIRHVLACGESTVLPWQVAVEFLAKLRKWEAAGKLSADGVASHFNEFLAAWIVAIPTVKIFPLAMQLYGRCSLSHWDSLLIAACQEAGVSRLYSEDTQHGADYDGVKILNPFVANPKEPQP